MSCPWMENREATEETEKTKKYAPLRFELKRWFPGYDMTQHNMHH